MSETHNKLLMKIRKTKTAHPKHLKMPLPFMQKPKIETKNEIDPLKFLERYSLKIKPINVVEEYQLNPKKEEEKKKPGPQGMGMGMGLGGGAYGAFKINLADILKARNNLGNKNPGAGMNPISAAVQKAVVNEKEKKEESDSDSDTDSEKDSEKDDKEKKEEYVLPELSEERLEVTLKRLKRAKRRFAKYYEKKNKILYESTLLIRAEELEKDENLPDFLLKRVKDLIDFMNLPPNCIQDKDVQIFQADKDLEGECDPKISPHKIINLRDFMVSSKS